VLTEPGASVLGLMHAAFMQRLPLFVGSVEGVVLIMLSPVGWHRPVGECGVRPVEVEAAYSVQSWDGAAMAERGSRSVVANRGLCFRVL